jgi:hypothetical protein
MRREDVNDCRDHKEEEQGHVKNAPKLEETVTKCEGRSFPDGSNMWRHEVCYVGESRAPSRSRPPKPLASARDHLPRIGNQPHTNNGSTPASRNEMFNRIV